MAPLTNVLTDNPAELGWVSGSGVLKRPLINDARSSVDSDLALPSHGQVRLGIEIRVFGVYS
jgi:hypothetical protein